MGNQLALGRIYNIKYINYINWKRKISSLWNVISFRLVPIFPLFFYGAMIRDWSKWLKLNHICQKCKIKSSIKQTKDFMKWHEIILMEILCKDSLNVCIGKKDIGEIQIFLSNCTNDKDNDKNPFPILLFSQSLLQMQTLSWYLWRANGVLKSLAERPDSTYWCVHGLK